MAAFETYQTPRQRSIHDTARHAVNSLFLIPFSQVDDGYLERPSRDPFRKGYLLETRTTPERDLASYPVVCMFKARVLAGMAFIFLIAMVWLDWNFPTHMYYSPNPRTNETISVMLLFKKAIELGLSLSLFVITVAVVRLKQSGNGEKFVASVTMGGGIGFWLHRDLIYLLLH